MPNEDPYFCCGRLPSEGHTRRCMAEGRYEPTPDHGEGALTDRFTAHLATKDSPLTLIEALPPNELIQIWDGRFKPGKPIRRITHRPDKIKWSGGPLIPKPGEAVKVTMNGLGEGLVTGYFLEHGYLGLVVKLKVPPAWYLRQNKGVNKPAFVFGAELAA